MGRSPDGQVLGRETTRGITWALRFQAYGRRRYLTLGSEHDGWTRRLAEDELQGVLTDVRRGLWTPPTRTGGHAGAGADVPDFHRFASDWVAHREGELSGRTVEYYRWALRHHLLPYFAGWPLIDIDVEAVDEYRRFKVVQSDACRAASGTPRGIRDRGGPALPPLSAASINKTIEVLRAVLSLAVEYGHIGRNPAAGSRRRLRVAPSAPLHLETVDQIEALLEAARRLDERSASKIGDRLPLVAVLMLAGLRAGETCSLRWRDVDLANSRLRVARSKTRAGIRRVTLLPLPGHLLASHRAASRAPDREGLVFPNLAGGMRDTGNLRSRVLDPVLIETERILLETDRPPLPGRITPHKLRHAFASILIGCGEDPAWVMGQLGHTDPRFTLRVYAHPLVGDADGRRRLRALVAGDGSRGWGTTTQAPPDRPGEDETGTGTADSREGPPGRSEEVARSSHDQPNSLFSNQRGSQSSIASV
jgi:integrase